MLCLKRKINFAGRLSAATFCLMLTMGIGSGCGSKNADREVAPLHQGDVWLDTDSNQINAHGGGMLYYDGTYYWYGEHRPGVGSESKTQDGVNCYSSTDLSNWKYEGLALSVEDVEGHDIERGCTIERPKVIYNDSTHKFVMWFHLELKGRGYEAARACVAVSDTPVGPFKFIRSGRVNAGVYPMNMSDEDRNAEWNMDEYEWWTPEWREAVDKGMIAKRDLEGGQMSRDMTLFVDDDGKAYHIYSSEENLTLNIAELSDDYLSHTGRYVRVAPGGHNEAPAIMKHDGRYWMITSGCTGWAPNEARLMTATDIFGPWQQLPNPCVGPDAKLTFGGQSTYILKVAGKDDAYMAMFDRWRPENLLDSRYVWLPIDFDESGTPVINWVESWTPLTYWDNNEAK